MSEIVMCKYWFDTLKVRLYTVTCKYWIDTLKVRLYTVRVNSCCSFCTFVNYCKPFVMITVSNRILKYVFLSPWSYFSRGLKSFRNCVLYPGSIS